MKKIKTLSSLIWKHHVVLALISLFVLALSTTAFQVYAAGLTSGSASMSDPRPGQTSRYQLNFSNVTTTQIACIQMIFSTAATGATPGPTGFSATAATLDTTASTNYVPNPSGWSLTAPAANIVHLTYTGGTSPVSASSRLITLANVTNGTTPEVGYFIRFATYTNTNCATGQVDTATIMYIHTNGQTVTLTVDPSLSYTLAAVNSGQTVNNRVTTITTTTTTVPFGSVSSAANAVGAHDITIGTNAAGGYTLYTRYTTQPFFSGGTITDHSGSNASPSAFSAPGSESFGYTTDDNTLGTGTTDRFTSSGGNKWAAFTTSNAEVGYDNGPTASTTHRIGYQVGVSNATEAGAYTTTVIYTVTPTY